MKRKLFIGSSTEGLNIAYKFRDLILEKCSTWIDVNVWKEGDIFAMNSSTLNSLVWASRRYDYGVLVATNDDVIESRKTIKSAPRDNVILEVGMFLGSLGLTRAFLLLEEEGKVPSDYYGVTVPTFNVSRNGSLEIAMNSIINAIEKTRFSFSFKPIPSTALAIGYFDSFLQKLAKRWIKQSQKHSLTVMLPQSIKDISTEISVFRNSNPSTPISVYEDGQRPIVHHYNEQPTLFWDIPTTLSTLSKLIDIALPVGEAGISLEKQDWVHYEVNNFAGTLRTLIQECPACRDLITVKHMN